MFFINFFLCIKCNKIFYELFCIYKNGRKASKKAQEKYQSEEKKSISIIVDVIRNKKLSV